MKGFVNGYYQFCVWIMRFAYLNILWISFSVIGLIVFGFMPATIAMFTVTRKWIRKETDVAIFKTFWKAYRGEFVKANIWGYILFLIGYVLTIELHILQNQDSLIYQIASFGIVAILFLYFIIVLYFFPIFVHFNLKFINYIKWPFIIGIIHPILTIVLSVVIIGMIYIMFITVPALIFFFGGSVTAYVQMWAVSKTFSKYEKSDIGITNSKRDDIVGTVFE